jgi:hypothetical protein
VPLSSPRFWFAAIIGFIVATSLLVAGFFLGLYIFGPLNDPTILLWMIGLMLCLLFVGLIVPVALTSKIEDLTPLASGAVIGCCAAPVISVLAIFVVLASL